MPESILIATIHLLLCILYHAKFVGSLDEGAVGPLLFADGVYKILLSYPENCFDWIRYLQIDQLDHLLHPILSGDKLTLYNTMKFMNNFFKTRDNYNAQGFYDGKNYRTGGRTLRTGHNLIISNTAGDRLNLVTDGSTTFKIHDVEKRRVEGFIKEISKRSGWNYISDNWSWNDLSELNFKKGILSNSSSSGRLNIGTYIKLFNKNPFSLAMTAQDTMEYSIEI